MAQGRTGSAELLAIDVIHDLALLRLRGAQGAAPIEFTPLAFRSASAPLAKGERLYSLGNPLDVGFAVAEGIYNGPVERSFLPQIFFGGSLNPGMSGGPAVDDAGPRDRRQRGGAARWRAGELPGARRPRRRSCCNAGARRKPQTQPMYAEVTRQLRRPPGGAGGRLRRATVAQRQPPRATACRCRKRRSCAAGAAPRPRRRSTCATSAAIA